MTTPARERLYLAQHQVEHEGRPFAVYNPHDKPIHELPVIYGFNNGGSPGWLHACLLADDGTVLGGHICSGEGYMFHDLGLLEGCRPDRHETFRKHYPDGYRMEWVSSEQLANNSHERFEAAVKRHQEPDDAIKEALKDADPGYAALLQRRLRVVLLKAFHEALYGA